MNNTIDIVLVMVCWEFKYDVLHWQCRDKIPDILYFTQYALPDKVWQSFQGDFTYLFPDRVTYNIKDPFKMFLLFLYNSTPQL
jgi:hypothetical protein